MSFYFIVFILKMFFFVLLFYEIFFTWTTKITPEVNELAWNQKGRFCEHGKFIGDILRLVNFNTALEEYKVRYPDGKSDCITKNCFFSVRVIHFLFLNFPGSNSSSFLFFTSFSLAVFIKFVLTKQKLITGQNCIQGKF